MFSSPQCAPFDCSSNKGNVCSRLLPDTGSDLGVRRFAFRCLRRGLAGSGTGDAFAVDGNASPL